MFCSSCFDPGTTRQPRDGEISGVDYNFVSIEEFFSLEESGALLESGKFKGQNPYFQTIVSQPGDWGPLGVPEQHSALKTCTYSRLK